MFNCHNFFCSVFVILFDYLLTCNFVVLAMFHRSLKYARLEFHFRGGTTLNFSLSSRRCQDEGWMAITDSAQQLIEPPLEFLTPEAEDELLTISVSKRK